MKDDLQILGGVRHARIGVGWNNDRGVRDAVVDQYTGGMFARCDGGHAFRFGFSGGHVEMGNRHAEKARTDRETVQE